ncbi:MAG: UDP-2,3-diacylglucosamine diphosphatase [Anaerolineae bacterium]|nr:UDP-2,3-diacylglucosamine diphosphatase [Gemmatimonadaceae bacterium]
MLASPCYILSDTHLGVGSSSTERQLVAFLRSLPGRANSLLINGDLFDFWFEWKTVIPRAHFRTLAALADLREAGIDVVLIAGNHDCWGGDVLTSEVGLTYHLGLWEGSLAGWRAQVEHGDGLRPTEDRKYRMLRSVLRHPASVRAFRWLHPDWGTLLARRSSHTSRTHRPWGDAGEGLRNIARERLRANEALELLVLGHSHAAVLERTGGGIYANAGSWLTEPTYMRVTPDVIELRLWDGSAEGRGLHALDRSAQEPLAHT